jgi:hypothetical protein
VISDDSGVDGALDSRVGVYVGLRLRSYAPSFTTTSGNSQSDINQSLAVPLTFFAMFERNRLVGSKVECNKHYRRRKQLRKCSGGSW